MAGLDYGVITIKNKKLLPNQEKFISQGEGGFFVIGNTIFDRTNPLVFENSLGFDSPWNSYLSHLNNGGLRPYSSISMYKSFDEQRKKVLRWKFKYDGKDIFVKTKELFGFQSFYSSFSIDNDHYVIIHGYDVSLKYFHSRDSKKAILNFLKKKLN